MEITYRPFRSLDGTDVYDLLALRQRVFVVEQACAYLDADGLDRAAQHLLIRQDRVLVACARVLAPGVRFPSIGIGRVVVAPERRGSGLGRVVMQQAVSHIENENGASTIMLAAQAHLERFYGSLGFERVSDEYDEDGIAHIDMRRG